MRPQDGELRRLVTPYYESQGWKGGMRALWDRSFHYDMRRVIGLRGCERSGTNLAQHWLLGTHHFPDITCDPRGKHSTMLVQNVVNEVVVISKHPFAWAVSFWRLLHNSAARIPWTKEQMTGRDFEWLVRREKGPDPRYHGGLGAWWCGFYRFWTKTIHTVPHSSRKSWRVLHVRYEDLLTNPTGEIHRISDWLGVDPPKVEPMPELRYHSQSEDMNRFDPAYYTEEHWREHYDAGTWRRLEGQLDWSIVEDLGYERLEGP